MEKVESSQPTPKHFSILGEGLANLHQITSSSFGLDHDNYIGLNRQINTPHENWGTFFYECRLKFQVDLINPGHLQARLRQTLDKNQKSLVAFLNDHNPHPSLLHGDLWSGNVLYSQNDVYLIDPAVHYGDRECDLAMTSLFGGFDSIFYERYSEILPARPGTSERVVIYQLYHYLNHYNIFGSSYLNKVLEGFQFIEQL